MPPACEQMLLYQGTMVYIWQITKTIPTHGVNIRGRRGKERLKSKSKRIMVWEDQLWG